VPPHELLRGHYVGSTMHRETLEETIWHVDIDLVCEDGKRVLRGVGLSQWRTDLDIPFLLFGNFDDKVRSCRFAKLHMGKYDNYLIYQCSIDSLKSEITLIGTYSDGHLKRVGPLPVRPPPLVIQPPGEKIPVYTGKPFRTADEGQ